MLGFNSEEVSGSIHEWIERLHPADKFRTLKILTSLKKTVMSILIFTTGSRINQTFIAG